MSEIDILKLAKRTVNPSNNDKYSWEVIELKTNPEFIATEWMFGQINYIDEDFDKAVKNDLRKEEEKDS